MTLTAPTYRDRFYVKVHALLGGAVLWDMKGPDAHDCSGSVTDPLHAIGGPDLRATDNAQALARLTRPLLPEERPIKGDLAFYGLGPDHVEHVAIVDETGKGVISADGATPHIDPRVMGFSTALARSMSNPANRVRLHASIDFRHDLPWHACHRNTLVDSLDGITL